MNSQLQNGLILGAIIAIFVCAAFSSSYFFIPTDFHDWRTDWTIFRACLRAMENPCSELSQFPMAYLLNSRFSGKTPFLLPLINIGFYALPVFLAFLLRGRVVGLKIAFVYAAALATSPIPLFYINTGALEIQSGILVGIAMSITILAAQGNLPRAPIAFGIAFVSAILVPLYKDTLFFILGTTFVGTSIILFIRNHSTTHLTRVHVFVLVSGIALGVLFAIGYNLYRYNQFYSVPYINYAAVLTPELSKSIEYFALSILSPNGGVLIFWAFPITIAYIVLRAQRLTISEISVLACGIMLFISCALFARWWSPFGWDSWGNRLMFQPVLSALITVLLTAETSLQKPSLYAPRFAIPAIAAFSLSAPYTILPYFKGAQASLYSSLWSEPSCVQMLNIMQTKKVDLEFWKSPVFYQCARERMLFYPPLEMARPSLR